MIMDMGKLRITEAELASDVHAILAEVQQGVEVVVEQDHSPVATIRTPLPKGRLLSESIALAEARGTTAVPDEGFNEDAEEGIAERSEPWSPRSGICSFRWTWNPERLPRNERSQAH